MLFRVALLLSVIATPVAAEAKNAIALSSDIFVESNEISADGKSRIVLSEPKRIVPGDTLIFVVRYQNTSAQAARNFVVTNPLPSAVAYVGDAGEESEVSVDGGRNWGALGVLKINRADGSARAATADDVTHIRWKVGQDLPAGQTGKFVYRGRVK